MDRPRKRGEHVVRNRRRGQSKEDKGADGQNQRQRRKEELSKALSLEMHQRYGEVDVEDEVRRRGSWSWGRRSDAGGSERTNEASSESSFLVGEQRVAGRRAVVNEPGLMALWGGSARPRPAADRQMEEGGATVTGSRLPLRSYRGGAVRSIAASSRRDHHREQATATTTTVTTHTPGACSAGLSSALPFLGQVWFSESVSMIL